MKFDGSTLRVSLHPPPPPIIVQYYIIPLNWYIIVYPKTSLSKKMGDACNGFCHVLAHYNMINFCVLRCTTHQMG